MRYKHSHDMTIDVQLIEHGAAVMIKLTRKFSDLASISRRETNFEDDLSTTI